MVIFLPPSAGADNVQKIGASAGTAPVLGAPALQKSAGARATMIMDYSYGLPTIIMNYNYI
jgi:hypothetical protein